MSRVGRLPIKVPSGVTVAVGAEAVEVKGPKGKSSVPVAAVLKIERDGDDLVVARSSDDRRARSVHGLTRKLLWNAVNGVSEGFTRVLEIAGVGYRAEVKGSA